MGGPHPETTIETTVRLSVNGRAVERTVPVRRLLADVLRDDLGLTGTHLGCEQGTCGACTVLVDDEPARSCTLLAVQVQGRSVTTIEGLDDDPAARELQQSFHRHHALQCGFCTPGFLCTLAAADPAEFPDEDAVRELLAGNLCRCTGYQHIVDAVRDVWHGHAPLGDPRSPKHPDTPEQP